MRLLVVPEGAADLTASHPSPVSQARKARLGEAACLPPGALLLPGYR